MHRILLRTKRRHEKRGRKGEEEGRYRNESKNEGDKIVRRKREI
jgi:hypothetical protein